MNKGIILVDMPEKSSDCIRCPLLNSSDECIFQTEEQNEMAETWEDLQRNCPIKPLPDKLPEYDSIIYTDGDGNVSKRTKLSPENRGWNACIDYMIGGNKDV